MARTLVGMLRNLLLVLLLIGCRNATADGALTFPATQPPVKVIQAGASTVPVFAGAPDGYGFLQISAPLPAECPNVYLHIPFTGSAGSKALYATAQVAFQTGSRVSMVIYNMQQGTCVINHLFLAQ